MKKLLLIAGLTYGLAGLTASAQMAPSPTDPHQQPGVTTPGTPPRPFQLQRLDVHRIADRPVPPRDRPCRRRQRSAGDGGRRAGVAGGVDPPRPCRCRGAHCEDLDGALRTGRRPDHDDGRVVGCRPGHEGNGRLGIPAKSLRRPPGRGSAGRARGIANRAEPSHGRGPAAHTVLTADASAAATPRRVERCRLRGLVDQHHYPDDHRRAMTRGSIAGRVDRFVPAGKRLLWAPW